MTIEGVDYSFARPSPQGLYNAGKRFAVRYGGPGSDGKQLTAGELAALRAAGLDVVANAEGSAGGYNDADTGRSWAASAEGAFRGLGMPADRPIYFSADWDASASDMAGIDAALRGSAAVIGAARVGIYGSYDVIEHCRKAGTAAWFWQTYAWSAGRVSSANHLYQYKNGVTVGGGDCDLTRAMVADYGQWGYQEDDMTPAEFNALMHGYATSTQGKADLAVAVGTFDPGTNADGTIKPGGVPNYGGDKATNPTIQPTWAWGRASLNNTMLYDLRDKIDALLVFAKAEAGEVPPTAEAIAATVFEVMAGHTAEDTAAALVAALGADRAAAVGRILSGAA